MTKQFDPRVDGKKRLKAEQGRLRAMMDRAEPPQAMRAAPVAPARGVMQLVPDYEIAPGGTRRVAGAHWVEPSPLDVQNAHAVEAALARDPEAVPAKAEVFSPGQVAMAARYRALVEWLAGSGMKCSRLDGGSGKILNRTTDMYPQGYSDKRTEVEKLHAAIGDGVILQVTRRNRGELRDKARRPLTVRAAVDGMVLDGLTLSRLITRHGWAANGEARRQVRDAIRAALDRMQGYGPSDGRPGRIVTYYQQGTPQKGD